MALESRWCLCRVHQSGGPALAGREVARRGGAAWPGPWLARASLFPAFPPAQGTCLSLSCVSVLLHVQ